MNSDNGWLDIHRKLRGKIRIACALPLRNRDDLNALYLPGSSAPVKAILGNQGLSFDLTMRGNSVAIVSDGSAVLGIGNAGPHAVLPVLEGKAWLLRELTGINGIPISIKGKRAQDMIDTVKNISSGFAGVILEDISTPRCFDIENALREQLNIPVFHDGQHGTAVALLAALINGCRATGRDLSGLRVLIQGSGYVGIAFAKLLLQLGQDGRYPGVREIVVCDRHGSIHEGRAGLNRFKEEIARMTNRTKRSGLLPSILRGMDIFIGASAGNILSAELVRSMNPDPILLALANPEPEISREEGYRGGAGVVCTGLADDPNQISSILVFPGLFRGALDARAYEINSVMKLRAAYALAELVRRPTREKLLPDPLDPATVNAVSSVVYEAAQTTGVAAVMDRRSP